MGRYWGGQSIRYNYPMGGAHKSYDTKGTTRPEYTSNKKKPLRKIRSAVVAMTETHTQTD